MTGISNPGFGPFDNPDAPTVVDVSLNGERPTDWDTNGGNSQDGALFSPKPEQIEVYPSGDFVDLLDPQPETIHLEDIAHHLSMCCRYAGGVKKFYSVAEHSVLVHDLMPYVVDPARYPLYLVDLQKAAILHDATEGYTGDSTAPLKYAMRALRDVPRSPFDYISSRLDKVIAERFGISSHLFADPNLKIADLWAMKLEATVLTKTGGANWRWTGNLPHGGRKPQEVEFVAGLKPDWAKGRFIRRVCDHTWPEEARC